MTAGLYRPEKGFESNPGSLFPWRPTMKKLRLLAVCVVAGSLAVSGFLILTAAAQTTPPKPQSDDPYQRIFEDQISRTKRYESLIAKQEELMKRQEDLMKRQEEAWTRFTGVVEKWEKQQAQYQKYLDGLGKK
jgi:hypothetical protein